MAETQAAQEEGDTVEAIFEMAQKTQGEPGAFSNWTLELGYVSPRGRLVAG